MISFADASARLSAALLCGVVLGLNRQLHGKRAGVRTLGIIALASALATSTAISADVTGAGATRVMQGIVAGIGFIGAGVIFKGDTSKAIHGLTTAAITWLSAALGIACGMGLYVSSLVTLLFTLILLFLGPRLEGWMHRRWPRTNAATEGDME